MIIVKLGGSIITDKSRYKVFRKTFTELIVRELADLEEEMVIVHGGGSFGHIMAKEYELPGEISEKRRIGAAIVHKDMVDLNQMVNSIMIERGICAISIPPSSFITGAGGNYEIFKSYLEAGMTPVSFGDVYLEDRGRFGIYSGDRIMLDLAKKFRPDRAVFISDVDGLYDKNPKIHGDARLLKSIYDDASFELSVSDVTGGIKGKIEMIKEMKEFVPDIYIMNGAEPERIRQIGTESFVGTRIS